MLKTLTTTAGLVLLVSSFALGGQTPAKPAEQPHVAPQSQQQRTQRNGATKKHHKYHKKQHAPVAAPKQ